MKYVETLTPIPIRQREHLLERVPRHHAPNRTSRAEMVEYAKEAQAGNGFTL